MKRFLIGLAAGLCSFSSTAIDTQCQAKSEVEIIKQTQLASFTLQKEERPPLEVNFNPQNNSGNGKPIADTPSITMLLAKVANGEDFVIEYTAPEKAAKQLIRWPISRINKKHGGFTHLDSFEVIWPSEALPWPMVVYTETSLPGEDDRKGSNFRPGPPLRSIFRFDSATGCYAYMQE